MDKIQMLERRVEEALSNIQSFLSKPDMEKFIEARDPKSIEDIEQFGRDYFNRSIHD